MGVIYDPLLGKVRQQDEGGGEKCHVTIGSQSERLACRTAREGDIWQETGESGELALDESKVKYDYASLLEYYNTNKGVVGDYEGVIVGIAAITGDDKVEHEAFLFLNKAYHREDQYANNELKLSIFCPDISDATIYSTHNVFARYNIEGDIWQTGDNLLTRSTIYKDGTGGRSTMENVVFFSSYTIKGWSLNEGFKPLIYGFSGDYKKTVTPYVWANGTWQPFGGNSVDVDSELSDTSMNPVQNKTVKAALDAIDWNNHAFHINYTGSDASSAILHNMMGREITLTAVRVYNVSSVKLGIVNGEYQTLPLTNGLWQGEIIVPTDGTIIVDAGRSSTSTVSCVSIKYK